MKRSPRVLSAALAVVLASSLCAVPAYAVDDEAAAQPPALEPPADEAGPASGFEEEQPQPQTEQAERTEGEPETAAQPHGELRVLVTEARETAVGTAFTASVADAGGPVATASIGLAAAGSRDAARFKGLADGSYTLTVSAPGIAPFSQAIEVAGGAASIELYVGGPLVGDADGAHAGLLVPGDANQDGAVDGADATAVIDAIEAGATDASCDVDGDGAVTLVDLQMAVANYGARQVDSTVVGVLPADAVKATAGEGVEVDGDLADLVGGIAPVRLSASEGQPIAVSFDVAATASEVGGIVVGAPTDAENAIVEGTVRVEYADGASEDIAIAKPDVRAAFFRSRAAAPTATVEEDGTVVIDFQGQVAVKKVTLVITKTAGAANLAEISKVEFLNDMEQRIPEPELNVPSGLAATPGSKKFSVSWGAETNVTGYELSIGADGKEEFKRTTSTSLSITSFGGSKIKNGTAFTLRVRSTNGAWRSPWSESVTVTPKAEKAPDAPEGLALTGAYRGLNASWKKMEDTDSYNLFYREKADGAGAYTKVEGITASSYQVTGLKDDTEYQVYATGVNEMGESAPSLTAAVRTANVNPAQLPAYRLVNTKDAEGRYLNHIASASYGRGSMVDSPLDAASGAAKSALGLFDDDYASYLQVNDWDEGGYYPGSNKGVTVTFDEPQTLGMISFAEVQDGVPFGKVVVDYRDESGAWKTADASMQMRAGANGRKYALAKLAAPVTASAVKVATGRAWWAPNVVIAEMRFHAYDSLEADIMALYADDLHLELEADVTAATVDALQQRLDAPDAASGEFHPYRTALQTELDAARALLDAEGLDDTVRVHNGISSARDNRALGIGGLNAWQPLGATAGAGDEIVVYVGAAGKAAGSSAPLKLVVSQQHPESSSVTKTATALKVGRNEITVPQLSSTDVERGGQLYVEYTGSNDADAWGVRVSGATAVPALDLYRVTDPAERLERTAAYVRELEAFVPRLEQQHDELHAAGGNANVRYAYDEKNCVLNVTDVMLDQIMYSAPAQQLLAAAGDGSTEERAAKMLASLDGMDQMMELFYQHKGLTNSFAAGTDAAVAKLNALPSQHLNIRYTRMFAGAFMYAAGNHIGIEWGSVPGLGQASPVVLDENGAKASGNFFGWGIAHEIGHNINQSQYAYAEVTNNYFAQLAQTDETNATTRFSYADVYDRVTSGDEGRTGSVFTQLAMYWQLRLAYDEGGAYELYDTYQQTLENRFFARVDSYARAPKTAPAPGGIELVLGGGESQNIMKLASAAAERDLTEFFSRWGMVPDEGTKAYLSQFAPEARAVQYANDDARAYARANEDVGAVAGKDVVSASATADGSAVSLTLGADASAADAVLGYEIVRVTTAGGQQQREVVGFSTDGSFVDDASSLGNRVVSYEVTAVDKFLNRSAPRALEPVKLDGDGLHAKDGWTVNTNMASDQDVVPPASEDDPDAPEPIPASALMVDGDADTVFTGVSQDADPVMTVDMGKPTEVTSVRYTLEDAGAHAALGAYRIETSLDGATYTVVKEGELALGDGGAATLYFDNGEDPWICTYDARYLRITGVGQAGEELSVGEIDVFGPSGDDVDLLSADGADAIGILKSDFVYQQAGEAQDKLFIPKGSLVFAGGYKGNPAYNVVVLYDGEGGVVGGLNADGSTVANQIIMAPAPGDALLGEVSEGSWVYWIEPDDLDRMLAQDGLPAQVRAELYRVDNALTNEGQRLVSDSLFATLPETLPEISLGGNALAARGE